MLMRIILIKLTLYPTKNGKKENKKKKKKKKKKHRLISWQNPIKIKRISVPYLLQAQLQ